MDPLPDRIWQGKRLSNGNTYGERALTSLPPTALVKITAEETGGGIQLTVCKLKQNSIN